MPLPSTNTPVGNTAVGKEETIELLGEQEEQEVIQLETPRKIGEETEDTGEVKEKEEEVEEIDELKELEEELEGPKDEDLELVTPVRRKEILTKYPNLFKDFPYLEKAYYRDQQFTEVYPTLDDAKEAKSKAEIMDGMERYIMSGDISIVLKAAREEDAEAFNKVVDNYLPSLRQVDQQAYYHVLGNVIKDTIITMVREGRAMGENGQPLTAAANILNQFVFGTNTFQPPTQLSKQTQPEDNERINEIERREKEFIQSQFTTVRDDLQTRADNVLRATIEQNIDPRDSMTDYVKKNAVKDAFEVLGGLIDKDARFRSVLDKLWERAFETKFSKDSTDRIKSAYLSKAKTLLPSVIKKARNDALRGMGKRVIENESEDRPEKKGPIVPGRSTSQSSGKIKKASDIPKGMSTLDVLMQD